ncbi:MAG: hypothetical protein C0617_12920 [Desulfuromonas sp.]|uniref:GSU3473 family protein n=1 Tax=Desulfuromonas sp. TaxID=892 RepID=UPI000CB736C2|nr:hypothetical protein [Desulfuromonas sp.]PLX82990.1 MAG: hypothetical protein C0617_12920 [Desulfuromonas sp.]
MMIHAVLKDGTTVKLYPRVLDHYLESRRVLFFQRSGGWVVVGRDTIRGEPGQSFQGRERRQHRAVSLH